MSSPTNMSEEKSSSGHSTPTRLEYFEAKELERRTKQNIIAQRYRDKMKDDATYKMKRDYGTCKSLCKKYGWTFSVPEEFLLTNRIQKKPSPQKPTIVILEA